MFENGADTVCGNVIFDGSCNVPADYTLSIPTGASLSGNGTLIGGWTVEVSKTDEMTYSVTYTNESDNAKNFAKEITLQQSSTDLTEGKVQTYNSETLTKDFTASAANVLTNGHAEHDDKYTLIVRFVENANMAGAEAQVEVTVTHNSLTEDMVTLSAESTTYNGEDQKPTVTVDGLTVGGSLTVRSDSAKSNNYNLTNSSVNTTGNITKASQTAPHITGLTVKGRAYDGTSTAEVTGVTLPRPPLTGGAASNYTLAQPAGAVPASVTVSKAAALTPKTGDLAVANQQAHTYTYGLGALRPDVQEGVSLGSTAVSYELGTVSLGSYYTSGAMIDGQTLTLPIDAVESDKEIGTGTITVIIHTQIFEDMTATIDVRSVNKIIPTGEPTLSGTTLTYGQALSTITLSGSMQDNGAPVPGTFAWSNPDNCPAVQETYAAAWTFTPDDNGKYAVVTGTALIQVLPAPIAGAVIMLEPAAFRYDGAGHRPGIASVTLDGTPLAADVDYTAAIPEGTEAGTYTVILPSKGNYTGTATAVFQINPAEQKPLDQKDDSHELRLEVETGLSTVPEALKANKQFNTPGKIETALRTRVAEVMSNAGEQTAQMLKNYLEGKSE